MHADLGFPETSKALVDCETEYATSLGSVRLQYIVSFNPNS